MKSLAFLLLTALSAIAGTNRVTVAWDAGETNVVGYRVFWGTTSRAYTASNTVAAPTTQLTIATLDSGTRYYLAATAFTAEELESDYSNEIAYSVPPNPPGRFRVVVQSAAAVDGPWDTLWTQTIPVSGEKPMRFIRSILKIEPKQ